MADVRFPDGFLWGAATAAHQVEGGNVNNDWWAFEHAPDTICVEPSGDACDSWHRAEEDAALLAEVGLGVYRFSLEWSRIEPEDGLVSRAALDRYGRLLDRCHDAGVEPLVTLHHFTTPRWVAAEGGWATGATVERFERYVRTVLDHLGDRLGPRVCTINEPNVVATCGYRWGVFPPGLRDDDLHRQATAVLIDAHRAAVAAVHEADPDLQTLLTLAMSEWIAHDGGAEQLARERYWWEDVFLEATTDDDLVGVQTYTREYVGPEGRTAPPEGVATTLMGYERAPSAVAATAVRAAEVTGRPVLVTEHGIATSDDADRIAFTRDALSALHAAIDDGLDLRGYVHWSWLDNFEWFLGYRPTFGLVEVDPASFERRTKGSARWLGEVARSGALPPAGVGAETAG
jgi:beta-glucosidase